MIRTINMLSKDLILVNDSQEAAEVCRHLGQVLTAFEDETGVQPTSFFVRVVDGDYTEVWGFVGIVPWYTKLAWRIVP